MHDLAAMGRPTSDLHAHAILRWLSPLVGSTTDRLLIGTVLLNAPDDAAAEEGLDFRTTLNAAVAALPPDEEQALLPGRSRGATLKDYQQLPPARRAGYGRRVVSAAFHTLAQRRLVPRYHVEENNAPSIGLASSLGLTPFVTVEHFVTRAPTG